MTTIPQQLRIHARQRPDKVALIDRDRSLSYAELDALVDGIAFRLADQGVEREQIVGVALEDHAEHLAVLLALGRVGAIILPLDPRWRAEEIASVADRFAAATVLHERVDLPPAWCRVDQGWWTPCSTAYDDSAITLDTPMVLSLSSGTTGMPKGPLASHRRFIARFTLYWIDLGLSARDIFLTATPLYFGGGRGFSLAILYAGGTVALYCPPYKPEELVAFANRVGATATFLVPTMLRRLLDLPGTAPLLPGMHTLISSGAAIYPAELAAVRDRISPNVFQYYSSTEGGGCCVLPPDMLDAHADSVGRPCFGVEVEVVDADHRPLPRNEVGRLRYRSAASASGYFRGKDNEAFVDGWFYPGDLASFDDNGFLHLRGRAKDMIIRGGVNIYPADIESALTALEGVADAAVVGMPSKEFGEEACAFVVARGLDEDALRTGCSERLARYKVPRRFILMASLPKTPLGKIDKKALASLAAASA